MSSLHALLLGLLQGLTEYLPISSSAHLKMAELLLGLHNPEQMLLFDLICHLGTLTALGLFFRSDLGLLRRAPRDTLWLIACAILPLFPFYFLLKPLREWCSQPELLGFFLMCTSAILFLGERWRVTRVPLPTSGTRFVDALWIGAMQSTALIPGISRSASTISCARVLGWDMREAVRFSFLLSIPTILGGNMLQGAKLLVHADLRPALSLPPLLIAFFSSAGVGWIVLRHAVRFLERGNLKPFAWYCLVVGGLVTLYLNLVPHG